MQLRNSQKMVNRVLPMSILKSLTLLWNQSFPINTAMRRQQKSRKSRVECRPRYEARARAGRSPRPVDAELLFTRRKRQACRHPPALPQEGPPRDVLSRRRCRTWRIPPLQLPPARAGRRDPFPPGGGGIRGDSGGKDHLCAEEHSRFTLPPGEGDGADDGTSAPGRPSRIDPRSKGRQAPPVALPFPPVVRGGREGKREDSSIFFRTAPVTPYKSRR